MILSMTGFGSASRTVQGVVVSAEVRALNSRFLDSRFRLPKQLESMEKQMNRKVLESCARGRITATVSLEPSSGSSNGALEFDRETFESYKDLTDKINKDYSCQIPVTDLVDVRELLTPHEPVELEEAFGRGAHDLEVSSVDQRGKPGRSRRKQASVQRCRVAPVDERDGDSLGEVDLIEVAIAKPPADVLHRLQI